MRNYLQYWLQRSAGWSKRHNRGVWFSKELLNSLQQQRQKTKFNFNRQRCNFIRHQSEKLVGGDTD